MALSDSELLEQTRLAIDALTTGGASAYTVAGRSVTKLDLPALWKQVEVLEARVARASSGSQATAVRFAEPG